MNSLHLMSLDVPGGSLKTATQTLSDRFKHLTFSSCEHLWSYLGKILLISRSFLNAAARSGYVLTLAGENFPNAVKDITNRLKLFAIVTVPFSVVNANSAAGKIFDGFLANDREEVALNALSFTIISADIVDSVTTFINASLVLLCANPVALFSVMGLPLGFTMAGLGTVSRIMQIVRDLKFANKTSSEVDLKQLSKKIQFNALGIVANALMLTAMTVFTLGSVTAFPHVLKGISYSTRLAALYHQDKK